MLALEAMCAFAGGDGKTWAKLEGPGRAFVFLFLFSFILEYS